MRDSTRLHENETAVSALRSALHRRGFTALDDGEPLSVRVEHAGRRFTVRLADHRWWRSLPGEPGTAIPVARQGSEDMLARQLVTELLGKL